MRQEWLRAGVSTPACWACFVIFHDHVEVLAVVGPEERIDGPMTPEAFHALFGRIGARAKMPFPIHPHMLRHGCGYAPSQYRPRHASAASLVGAQEHPAHGALHRTCAGSL
jgi:integrase